MKKYIVNLYYHSSIVVDVEAPDRRTAIEYAREKASGCDYDKEILNNLEEDDSPDVCVWNDQLKDYQAL